MIFIPDEVAFYTLVDIPRLKKIKEFLEETKSLMGVNAEVGVYKGGTAYWIAHNSTKRLYLFDTFEGMPQSDPEKDTHSKGAFNQTSLRMVDKNLAPFNYASLHKGIFPQDTGDVIGGASFSFVHLDCDIYKSVKDCLEFFYPRMVKGGIIALDDYSDKDCPGAKLATDEFLKDKPEKIFSHCQSQVAIKKGFYEQGI